MKTDPPKCQAMQYLVGSEEAQHYFLGKFCTFLRFCGNLACLHKITRWEHLEETSQSISDTKRPQKIYAVSEVI